MRNINWIGKSIYIIGLIHSVFGFVVFRSLIADVFSEGLINTVNGQPAREFGFWFLFFGFLVILLGLMVDWIERVYFEVPWFFGIGLLAVVVPLVTIMPISGGWLMFIPIGGVFVKKGRATGKMAGND